MEDKIKELFASILGVEIDSITDTTSPGDLEEWSSINHLNLVSTFEDNFSIDIDVDEILLMNKNYLMFKNIIQKKIGEFNGN